MATTRREAAVAGRTGRTIVVGRGAVVNAGPAERVGFYGCGNMDRVVRVGTSGMHFPRSTRLECPCGFRHRVSILWRRLNEDESLRAEVLV